MTSTTTRRGTRSTEHVRRFGELLRELREHYNLSMNELARQTGIPLHTIYRLEQGQIPKPALEDLAKLAKFFNIDLNLMGVLLGVWDLPSRKTTLTNELSRSFQFLESAAEKLTEEEQHEMTIQLRPLVQYWTRQSEQKPGLPDWLVSRLVEGTSRTADRH